MRSNTYDTGASPAVRDRRVTLNCGGTISQITLSLLQAHPRTLLAQLTASLPLTSLASGDVFLDRDPLSFATILNWYRYGKLLPPPNLPSELLADDIVFFRLPVLSDAARSPTAYTDANALASPRIPSLVAQPSYASPSPISRAPSQTGSQVVEVREFPFARDEPAGSPTPAQPLFAPQFSHMQSVGLGMPAAPPGNYASVSEVGGSSGIPASTSGGGSFTFPAVNILPPTPPIMSAANSVAMPAASTQLQQQRSFSGAPMLVHQLSGSGVSSGAAAGMENYLNLATGDVHATQALPTNSTFTAAPMPHPVQQQPHVPVVQPVVSPAAAAPALTPAAPVAATPVAAATAAAAAAPASSTPASAASSDELVIPAPGPRPRVPFDLAIEMLSCFQDINRAAAQSLLEGAAAADSASAVGGAKASAGEYAAAPEPGNAAGEGGHYLFRYCNDPDERLADGSPNRDLFVLCYLHGGRMYNTKVFRHFIGRSNALNAPSVQGFVLSEQKQPTALEQMHTSIVTLTHAIIGTHAKAMVLEQ